MGLFDRRVKPDEFKLAFEQGVIVGTLRAELDQVKAMVEQLAKNQPAGPGLPALDSSVEATVAKLSRNDPALYRLLDRQAKELLAKHIPVERVIEQLELGHRGPRLATEKKA